MPAGTETYRIIMGLIRFPSVCRRFMNAPRPKKSARWRWCLAALAAVAGLAACASPRIAQVSVGDSDRHLEHVLGVSSCRDAIAEGGLSRMPGLDPGGIRLTNWNVEKKGDPSWRSDLDRLSPGVDLILLQEASLREDTINELAELDATLYWSFAPGYRSKEEISKNEKRGRKREEEEGGIRRK